MALIRCEECGRNITDTIRKCPHCGHRNVNYRNIPLEKIKDKKFIIVAIFAILIFIAIGTILCLKEHKEQVEITQIEENKLTEEEQIGAKAVKKLKGNFKNQATLNVNQIWYRKTNLSENQLLVEYSVSNENQNNIVVLIENDTIIGNDSKADKNISKYTSETEKNEIQKSKDIKELWDTKGGYIEPFVALDTNKILKNLD